MRAMTPSDIPAVIGAFRALHAESPFAAATGRDLDEERCAEHLLNLIEAARVNDDVFCRVKTTAAGLVEAFGLAERVPDPWWSCSRVQEYGLYVSPHLRGSGVGRELLMEFKDWAEDKPGIVRVSVGSGIQEKKTGRLFERMGWAPRGAVYGTEIGG